MDIQVPENTAIELFVDGIPYSEESYVRFPEKYGATEYGAKYVRETRIPVKDIKAFAMEPQNGTGQYGILSVGTEQANAHWKNS